MEFLQGFANTNNKDFTGKISFDFHGISENIHTLCKDNGIDTNKFFPIAFSTYDEDALGVGHHSKELRVSIYCIDKNTYGNNFDAIADKIQSDNGVVTTSEHKVSIPFDQIGKYIKRFSIMAVSEMGNHISEFKIENRG